LALRLPLILFTASVLLCWAPGFDSDEKMLDPRVSSATISDIRRQRERQRNPIRISAGYVRAALRGDLGTSTALGVPVAELLSQRWGVTACALAAGAGAGWLGALVTATAVAVFRMRRLRFGASAATTILICTPSSVVGIIVSLVNGSVAFATAAVVFPRVYQYIERVLSRFCSAAYVQAAEAAGVPPLRRFFRVALPGAVPELIAVAGMAVNLGIAALVPLEVVCGAPGIAELAWKSALGRDVPVLLSITLCIAAASSTATALVDMAAAAFASRQA
jgi:ABC-type dipeptide/oligopeptide/nickel transport system permease component